MKFFAMFETMVAVAILATVTTATATETVWRIGHRADPAATVGSQERETDIKVKVDQKTTVQSGAKGIIPGQASAQVSVKIGDKEVEFILGEDGKVKLAPSDPKETPKEEDSKETPEEEISEEPAKVSKRRGALVVKGNQGNTSVARRDVINNNYGSHFSLPEGKGKKRKITVGRRVYRVRPANRGFAGLGLR